MYRGRYSYAAIIKTRMACLRRKEMQISGGLFHVEWFRFNILKNTPLRVMTVLAGTPEDWIYSDCSTTRPLLSFPQHRQYLPLLHSSMTTWRERKINHNWRQLPRPSNRIKKIIAFIEHNMTVGAVFQSSIYIYSSLYRYNINYIGVNVWMYRYIHAVYILYKSLY